MSEHDLNEGEHRIWGPPGTGKTTSISRLVQQKVTVSGYSGEGPSPVCVTSLTRSAAAEVVGKFAKYGISIPRYQVGTLHSMAFHSIGEPGVVVEHIDEWNKLHPALELSQHGKNTDDFMLDRPSAQTNCDLVYENYQLLRARQISRDYWPHSAREFAALWEAWKAGNHIVDFPDMIDYALQDIESAPGAPNMVVGDECQDYSAHEMALLRKWGKSAGTLVMGGDPDQAIFCWRGADPVLFFDERVPKENRRLLKRSHRVPRLVLDVALEFRNQLSDCQPLEYLPRLADENDPKSEEARGSVFHSKCQYNSPGKLIDFAAEENAAGRTVMFLASCGYMLDTVIHELRGNGIPFSNPWRRTNGRWNPIRQSGTSIAERILSLLRPHEGVYTGEHGTQKARIWDGDELRKWASVLNARRIIKHGSKKLIEDLDDTTGIVSEEMLDRIFEPEALGAIRELLDPWVEPIELVRWFADNIQQGKQKTAEYACRMVERLGVKSLSTSPKTFIGTIHSVKGAEADTVILFPDLSPAAAYEWEQNPNSVIRTFYVGITRARERLIVCNSAGNGSEVRIPMPNSVEWF